MTRENLIARTFVELADTLVEGYDPIELVRHLAERCVEVLGVAGAGLVLVDAQGQLQALAPSSDRTQLIELIEMQRKTVRASTAGAAVRPSPRITWPRPPSAGHTSPPPPERRVSVLLTPCRSAFVRNV